MKRIEAIILATALLLSAVACSKMDTQAASAGESAPFGSEGSASASIDASHFNIVGYDYEPGDFRYQFELTAVQKIEFEAILQMENWEEARQEQLPEHGLACALSAKSDKEILHIFPWNETTSIISIAPLGPSRDAADTAFYFAPFEVGEDAKLFMQRFGATPSL